MRFDFDPAKDAANRFKHGVPLLFGMRIFDVAGHVFVPSTRLGDGEDRLKVIGYVDGKLWTMVFNERESGLRLISVRRSNGGEQRDYDRYSARPGRS